MAKSYNVAVLGAAGGIGQPLSLLLKQSPQVKKLVLFDVVKVVEGVAADLSHIETPAEVIGVAGDLKDAEKQKLQLNKALKHADIVIIPAGIPRKPGMSRDDLFKINAGIVMGLVEGVATTCPKAMICIISNPVNSTVPIAAEVLKRNGVYDKKRLFGVSTLDIVRSNTFVSSRIGLQPSEIDVTVIGGHSGVSILPLLSEYSDKLQQADIVELTKKIRTAGTEVVEAKNGAGSATLSMGYAGARFAIALMKAMSGAKDITECAYVNTTTVPGVDYFASKICLGPSGAEKVLGLGKLSDYEQTLLEEEVLPELKKSIAKGVQFVNKE